MIEVGHLIIRAAIDSAKSEFALDIRRILAPEGLNDSVAGLRTVELRRRPDVGFVRNDRQRVKILRKIWPEPQIYLAARLQLPDRTIDRIVLHIADEHMRPRCIQRFDGKIERVGRVQREDHIFRLVAAEEGRQRLPTFVYLLRGAQRQNVPAAPRISAVFADAFGHFRVDTVRLRKCGRGVVKVDHSVYSS